MLRPVQDRYLPPDHDAFVKSEPPTGRVIIIAPTRAACETIEIAVGLHHETYLERTHGEKVRELARSGKGFGIIAGTGTGKTLAIRPIAEEILKTPLHVGVVNREREATPELPNLNVIVVTTGIARRWFQDGDILRGDTLVVDEIHQTSAELELCLALGKRVGCRFIWLSATVDPKFYSSYLGSAEVLQVFSFDPDKAADVRVVNTRPREFLGAHFLGEVVKRKRGVGIFLPTRAGVEQAAVDVKARAPKLRAAHYHGGEPVRAIRPFLEEGGASKPYVLAMTAAGQSALNVRGLDTVVIDDTRFTNVISGGRNVLTRQYLGSNEILQMAGRVHGRVEGGRVIILSDREIDFHRLRPTAPEFQLAGDSERVALTCADLGVRADQLELPVPLDGVAYRRAYGELQRRGIIDERGKLTTYGKSVEALPVERSWAELILHADDDLVPYLAVMSSIESLHRMTRDERNIDDLMVAHSDHLTAYNLYAEAFERSGYLGEVYGLDRHMFQPQEIVKWADERGVLVKSIEDAALAMASLFRSVGMPLPKSMPYADHAIYGRFTDLLARFMPFSLAIDETTADGQQAQVSKTSVCTPWGAIAGELRYFADRYGNARASIEGTQIPLHTLRRYAQRPPASFDYNPRRKQTPLVLKTRVEYFGFELEEESVPVREFTPDMAPAARRALAEALASFEGGHVAVHRNRVAIEEIREMYRRSGGTTPRLGFKELTDWYAARLEEQDVNSLQDFRDAKLLLSVNNFISPDEYERLLSLPTLVTVRGRPVEIHYELEGPDQGSMAHSAADDAVDDENGVGSDGVRRIGVARLRLPQSLAPTLKENELPQMDRPLRFSVQRGHRPSVQADSLAELQHLLGAPDEPEFESGPARDAGASPAPPRSAPRRPKPSPLRGRRGKPRRGFR